MLYFSTKCPPFSISRIPKPKFMFSLFKYLNKEYKINLKFYKYYLESKQKQIRSDLADGTSKLTINADDFMNYYVEYIPYEKQIDFYEKNIKKYENLALQLKESKRKLIGELSTFDIK